MKTYDLSMKISQQFDLSTGLRKKKVRIGQDRLKVIKMVQFHPFGKKPH